MPWNPWCSGWTLGRMQNTQLTLSVYKQLVQVDKAKVQHLNYLAVIFGFASYETQISKIKIPDVNKGLGERFISFFFFFRTLLDSVL